VGRLADGFGIPTPFGHARGRPGGAIESRRIDEIDRVDTVAAAALGGIHDVIEDREPAEVGVLADLVRRVAKLRDVEAADGRGEPWVLRDERLCLGGKDLRARADDDPIRLRIRAIPSVAGRIENVCAVRVVQDRCPAIIAAVRIRFCEAKFPVAVNATTRKSASLTGLVGSTTPGVLEFDTSSASIGDR
jgi:hypothetical protein